MMSHKGQASPRLIRPTLESPVQPSTITFWTNEELEASFVEVMSRGTSELLPVHGPLLGTSLQVPVIRKTGFGSPIPSGYCCTHMGSLSLPVWPTVGAGTGCLCEELESRQQRMGLPGVELVTCTVRSACRGRAGGEKSRRVKGRGASEDLSGDGVGCDASHSAKEGLFVGLGELEGDRGSSRAPKQRFLRGMLLPSSTVARFSNFRKERRETDPWSNPLPGPGYNIMYLKFGYTLNINGIIEENI